MRITGFNLIAVVIVAGWLLQSSHAQDVAVYSDSATSEFVNFPNLPTCMKGSVQNGDPSKGGSVILGKGAKGCTIPWHWHTANEQLMMISGRAEVQMKDGKTVMVDSGDYLSMPSKHVHQFACQSACTLFIMSNVAFDIHYVDSSGSEISTDEALKKKL